MSLSLSDIIDQLMPLIDPKGYTAEDFCEAVRDLPKPSAKFPGCETSVDVAAHWVDLAKAGRLAAYRAGTTSPDGVFKAFDIPWVYDAREEVVGYNSIDILSDLFKNPAMKNRHWGVIAERMMEAGKLPETTLPEALFALASAAQSDLLKVDFINVISDDPYATTVNVEIMSTKA